VRVSSRVGPILIAIGSVLVRLAGEPDAADLVAAAAFAAITFSFQRSASLPAAARIVHSCNRLTPTGVTSSVAAR
jgi:hypothetical protein